MKKIFLTLIVALTGCLAISAQSRGGLRINEVMVVNENSVVDDYGQREAWIELYNSTYAPLEISSVYLTTDSKNPKMYPVPLGDVNTEIPARQHVIFWADGQPDKGTFHTSLILEPGKDNWIGVYDADGITLIDSVVVPAALTADQSYARHQDGVLEYDDPTIPVWEVRDGSANLYITPSSNNVIKATNSKVDLFHDLDKSGGALTVMAMCIVFTALLVLCLCFVIINKIGSSVTRRNKMKAHGIDPSEIDRKSRPDHDSGEEIAAIVMALHEHLDAHDNEQTILTINKVKKAYSPWSSKIYNMRELPSRK